MSDIVFYRGENPLRADKLNAAFDQRMKRSGEVMTGPLTLYADPTDPMQPVTLQYFNNHTAGTGSQTLVVSFNTRTGDVVLGSGDVTTALGYTPYSNANPAGYQTASDVNTAINTAVTTTSLPVAYTFPGKPPASAVVNVPMPVGITVPVGLVGTQVYFAANPTSAVVFVLNCIHSGAATEIGRVQIASSGTVTLSGSGGSLVIGDTLQMVAPSSQDTTLAEVGITILTTRV